MDGARTPKSRSVAPDQKTAQQSTTKRPAPSRHKSDTAVPAVSPRRKSDAKRLSEQTKASAPNSRSSKTISEKASLLQASSTAAVDRRRGNNHNSTTTSKTSEHESPPLITFAVLGAPKSGRTTFVRQALELRKPSTGPLSSSKVSLSGSIYRIELLELSIDDVDASAGRDSLWPKFINNIAVPTIQGVFCLYDVTSKDSVTGILELVSLFSNCHLPCMVIACKADVPDQERSISTQFHHQVSRADPGTHCEEVSFKSAESQKICLLGMLRRVLANIPSQSTQRGSQAASRSISSNRNRTSPRGVSPQKRQQGDDLTPRGLETRSDPQKPVSTKTPPLVPAGQDVQQQQINSSHLDDVQVSDRTRPLKSSLKLDTTNVREGRSKKSATPTPRKEPSTTRVMSHSDETPLATAVPSTSPQRTATSKSAVPGAAQSNAFKTFFNAEEESHDESLRTRTQDSTTKPETSDSNKPSQVETGIPLAALVRRLLALPTTKTDSDFLDRFLCLYRAFASPRQLFLGIVDEWVNVERSTIGQFAKVAELLRFLQVLSKWTATYPGDFSGAPVRTITMAFIQEIEKSKHFGPAAKEISNNLEAFAADDDSDWAYEEGNSLSASTDGYSTTTKTGSMLPTSPIELRKSAHEDYSNGSEDEDLHETDSSTRNSRTPSTASSLIRTGNTSSQSFANFENARHNAMRFRLRPHVRLSKLQWHHFMDAPLEDLAREITRIDWTMYSAIRPRDYLRHVHLSTEKKRRSKQNDNIHMMVKHFNHLALFVSGMVLLRDKPKHRSKALEKLMALAWKIRQLNNYNSLGAIVAGITGHEISRLSLTRDLIPPETQKEFLRLTILMGISRSHAAYRMAWENSETKERIPFLPLLKQDLTMAAAANPTFVGRNINWKKFEIMGDVIIAVQRNLEQPYTFPLQNSRTDDLIRLILETKIVEDSEDSADPRSELHDRSVEVEPPPSVVADPRKRFDWLRR